MAREEPAASVAAAGGSKASASSEAPAAAGGRFAVRRETEHGRTHALAAPQPCALFARCKAGEGLTRIGQQLSKSKYW